MYLTFEVSTDLPQDAIEAIVVQAAKKIGVALKPVKNIKEPAKPDVSQYIDVINQMIAQAGSLPEEKLYAGLTMMTGEIISLNARTVVDNEWMNVASDILVQESAACGGSLWFSQQVSIPHGWFNSMRLHPILFDDRIVHEWTRFPGMKLYAKFSEKFKEVICGKDGPYEKFNNGLINQADLPAMIAATILSSGISITTFWIPVIVYISILIVKTGLKVYCES